jgi:hypothetical protein
MTLTVLHEQTKTRFQNQMHARTTKTGRKPYCLPVLDFTTVHSRWIRSSAFLASFAYWTSLCQIRITANPVLRYLRRLPEPIWQAANRCERLYLLLGLPLPAGPIYPPGS